MSKVNEKHRVIALDYYDGEVEGLVASFHHYNHCYFKLVAWSQGQDKRLYSIIEVDVDMYNKLIRLLTLTQEQPSVPVWIPRWSFSKDSDEQEANRILGSFQKALFSSKLLVLGNSILDEALRSFQVNAQTLEMYNRVLIADSPDNLSSWLPLLDKNQ